MTQHSQQFSFPVISKADIIRHYYSKENLRMHNNDTSPALSHVLYNIFSDINRIYTAMAIWLYTVYGKYGNINININMAMLTFYMHVAQRKGIGIAALFTIMT